MRKLILSTLAMALVRWLTKPKARPAPARAPRRNASADRTTSRR